MLKDMGLKKTLKFTALLPFSGATGTLDLRHKACVCPLGSPGFPPAANSASKGEISLIAVPQLKAFGFSLFVIKVFTSLLSEFLEKVM